MTTLDADPFTLHANFGYSHLPQSSGQRRDIARAAAALQWAASDSLTLSIEATSARSDDPTRTSSDTDALLGMVLTLRPGLDFDFGRRTSVRAAESSRSWLMGLTWRFAP